jgi:hypothetical protein
MSSGPRCATGALAAALLLAGCTPGTTPAVDRALVIAGDATDVDVVTGVAVGADGTALLGTAGPAGRSGVTAVQLPGAGAEAAVTGSVHLTDTRVDLVVTAGTETLVVGPAGRSPAAGYAVTAVDLSTGSVGTGRPVPGFPAQAGDTAAVALPGGTVVVAGDRPGGTPFLLLLDPADAGTPVRPVELGALAAPGDRVQLQELAVSPDGSRIAVAFAVRPDRGPQTTALLVVDAALAPVGGPVTLDPAGIAALAVADDGTVYAAGGEEPRLLAVDPRSGAVREVPAGLGELTALAVAGDQLVAVSAGLEVARLAPADGTVTATTDLCGDTGSASGLDTAADGSLVVVANCAGAGLWVLPA